MKHVRLLLGLLALLFTASFAKPQVPPADPLGTHTGYGVTTHFSQGWPRNLIPVAAGIGAISVRDSLHWAAVETVRGQYTFTERNSGHVARICAQNMSLLLGIAPRNRLYDNGQTANSAATQAAFANYVLAIANRFPGCVIGIEVDNEINGAGNITGPAATRRAQSHTALLRAIHGRVKATHPDFKIIGGSTNTIATGFLERLFAAGALAYVDGIAVHPYRREPESVDWELRRLRAAMARHGSVKPIWATEFSQDSIVPYDGAPYFLKMVSLMQSAGVNDLYWYALIDQKWFPTMGLLTSTRLRKPAGQSFAFASTQIPKGSTVRRIDHGDTNLFHFRYGSAVDVVWGGNRSYAISGTARTFKADGTPIADPAAVTDEPIVIVGASAIAFGPPQVLADSLYGFAQAPLQWFARRNVSGALIPLRPIDWSWTTYLGTNAGAGIIVNSDGIGTAPGTSAVVRYTATETMTLYASACLLPLGRSGDGIRASIAHNGSANWSGQVGPATGKVTSQVSMTVQAGDTVDLVVSPNANAADDRMRYRYRLTRDRADSAQC